jgi:hypothetical protein
MDIFTKCIVSEYTNFGRSVANTVCDNIGRNPVSGIIRAQSKMQCRLIALVTTQEIFVRSSREIGKLKYSRTTLRYQISVCSSHLTHTNISLSLLPY